MRAGVGGRDRSAWTLPGRTGFAGTRSKQVHPLPLNGTGLGVRAGVRFAGACRRPWQHDWGAGAAAWPARADGATQHQPGGSARRRPARATNRRSREPPITLPYAAGRLPVRWPSTTSAGNPPLAVLVPPGAQRRFVVVAGSQRLSWQPPLCRIRTGPGQYRTLRSQILRELAECCMGRRRQPPQVHGRKGRSGSALGADPGRAECGASPESRTARRLPGGKWSCNPESRSAVWIPCLSPNDQTDIWLPAMARTGLVLYLVVATAVGPLPCCCGGLGFATVPEPCSAKAGPCAACCARRSPRNPSRLSHRGNAASAAIPHRQGNCPCEQTRSTSAVLIKVEGQHGAEPGRGAVPPQLLPDVLPFLPLGPRSPRCHGQGPPGCVPLRSEPRELLKALHVLHC